MDTTAARSPGQVSEMLIEDTFTKLIFGGETRLSDREQSIVHALRLVDGHIALASDPEMGVYLRALGVREMIALVSQVKDRLADGIPLAFPDNSRLVANPSLRAR